MRVCVVAHGCGDFLTMNRPDHRRASVARTLAAVLCLWVSQVAALTLGPARVQSALGEPLRVEVEFESLTPAEAETLRANVASPDVYRQAGYEYSASLAGSRVVLQRMANVRPSLRVTTDRAMREPFVELIIEVTWRGGKLARSYTLLFDPPQLRTVTTPAAISAPPAPNAPMVATDPPVRGPSGAEPGAYSADVGDAAARSVRAAAARRGPPPPGAADAPALVPDPYRVRPGDTLSEMAQRGPRPAGVSLDRLVLALYRANRDAFIDGNINKLKPGAVLEAPTAAAIAETTDADARRVIRAQSEDFNAYRRQLADMPAERTDAAGRRASGRVEAAVEDRRQNPATAPDRLTLSKPPVKASEPAADRAEARRQAEAKVAELSKNVQDLNRLSSDIARSGGAAASAPTARAGAGVGAASAPGFTLPIERVAPPPPVMPAPRPAVSASSPAPAPRAASAPVAVPAVPAPASRPASAAASAPLVAASAAASRPQAVASAPARPASKPTVPPTVAEPGLMDSLLDDNLPAVGLAGALIALLAAFGMFKLVQRRRAAPPETSFLESRLKPDSFFGSSGGQRIDTREVGSTGSSSSMMNYSLSQLDAIGDVDPVAEADVYLAYGRDLQAEEILKEALRTTPERLAIRTKLLEVYAKRRDVKGFEQLARQLQGVTGGAGEDWAKACQMGLQIDPDNPLYGGPGARVADRPALDDEAQGLSTLPQPMAAETRAAPSSEPPLSSSFDLDLDLDLGADEPPPRQGTVPLSTGLPPAPPTPAAPPRTMSVFPPDAAAFSPPAESTSKFNPPSGFGELTPPPPPPAVASVFPPGATTVPKAGVDPTPFSTSAFSLDLDLPPPSQLSAGPSMLPPVEGYGAAPPSTNLDPDSDFDTSDPLVRKMELADEFRQIGDIEGARDLLQEVVDRAEGAVKAKAAAMLAGLS